MSIKIHHRSCGFRLETREGCTCGVVPIPISALEGDTPISVSYMKPVTRIGATIDEMREASPMITVSVLDSQCPMVIVRVSPKDLGRMIQFDIKLAGCESVEHLRMAIGEMIRRAFDEIEQRIIAARPV